MEVCRIQRDKKRKQKVNQARAILDRRYDECDTPLGHIKPDYENNYCNHCFRHLKYNIAPAYASDPILILTEINP